MAENDAHYNKILDETNWGNEGIASVNEEMASINEKTVSMNENQKAGSDDLSQVAAVAETAESRFNVPVISFPQPNDTVPARQPTFPTTPGMPAFPNMPNFPGIPSVSPQFFGQVRFLNASTNTFAVNITIDNTVYALNSRFGTITNYDRVTDGFHTVTVRRASGMRSILLQQSFPFAAGQSVTMVLTDSASGELEMVRVTDSGCSNLPRNSGCYRFANMSFAGSRFDLLYGNETVFRNVGYQRVTSYKQAVAGTYPFTVASSNAFNAIRELPIIVIGAIGTSAASRTPVVNFDVSISAGGRYTSYLIGNNWSANRLQVMTVSDN